MPKADQDKARNFFREIRKAALQPLYLFHGEERYLINQALEEVKHRIFGDEEPDPFRFETFRGNDATGRAIVDAARTVPMLGGTRLVVVRDVDKLGDEHLAELARYAEAPSRRATVVLTATKFDGRKAVWKTVKKQSVEVLFQPLYRDQMAAWIVRQGKRRNQEVSPAAADYLAEAVGTDMMLVDLALEKLGLMCEDGRVDVEHAREVVSDTRERSVFELTDALSRRDLEGALRALHSLRDQGVDHIPITYMIARHVRLLLRVKSGQHRRLDERQLPQFVGVNPYFLKGYVAGARNFSLDELIGLHGRMFEADRALKSSRLPGDALLDALVLAFCIPGQQATAAS